MAFLFLQLHLVLLYPPSTMFLAQLPFLCSATLAQLLLHVVILFYHTQKTAANIPSMFSFSSFFLFAVIKSKKRDHNLSRLLRALPIQKKQQLNSSILVKNNKRIDCCYTIQSI